MFLKTVGRVVKCRTCKESFQVQPPEPERTIAPPVVQPVEAPAPVEKKREPIKCPDRTSAVKSVTAMRSQTSMNIIASSLVLIAGCMNVARQAGTTNDSRAGYLFGIGVLMLIGSWMRNAHLRRQAATLEIQVNIERLLVTIANNTSSNEWSQSVGMTVRDDAQKASGSAQTGNDKAS